MSHFTGLFSLLRQSGAEPAASLRDVCSQGHRDRKWAAGGQGLREGAEGVTG